MSAKIKWGLFATILITKSEIFAWVCLLALIVMVAWPIIKGGVGLD